MTIEQMRNIARLATTEWTMSAFAEQDFFDKEPITRRKIQSDYVIARCTGKVTGSVDMEKAQIDAQETAERRQVSIHFPRGSVLVSDPAIDPETLETISARTKIKGEWLVYKGATPTEREQVQREAISRIRQAALDEGIVDRTKENATTVLSEFVRSLGYEATVTFDDPAYDPQGPDAPAAGNGRKQVSS